MIEIKPGLALCKESTLYTILISLDPDITSEVDRSEVSETPRGGCCSVENLDGFSEAEHEEAQNESIQSVCHP